MLTVKYGYSVKYCVANISRTLGVVDLPYVSIKYPYTCMWMTCSTLYHKHRIYFRYHLQYPGIRVLEKEEYLSSAISSLSELSIF